MSDQQSPIDRRWKFPILPSVIRNDFARPRQQDVEVIEKLYVPDISDVVGRMYTATGLSSLFEPAIPVTGPAFTVKAPPGDNFALKIALTMSAPGDVIVVDAQGFKDWCLGGFQMLTNAIRDRGLKGLIVNGAYRDRSEARAGNFPIYVKALSTFSGPKIGPAEINVPICCGGVIVEPGDIVSASEDGIVVIPQRHVGLVVDHFSGKKAESESQILARLTAADRAALGYLDDIRQAERIEELKD